MERSEALRRYKKNNKEVFQDCNGDIESQVDIDLIEFDDEFEVVDIVIPYTE